MKTESIKVMIVDDEKSFTDAMRMNLLDEGFRVHVENDSTKAIEGALAFRPDVVLLDIVMPQTDGCDVLKKMKAQPELQHIPAIMVSALVSNREVGDEQGMHTPSGIVMAKPVSLEKLRHCIHEALATPH
ncbi:MAG: CheY-like chemotaxis protein [Verrucomicrobiales bacterium]|jgi:CheY-like chemotaxis protein